MPEMMTILTGAQSESCEHGVPNRVRVSMSFVGLMRQTGVVPTYEGGPTAERPQTRKEVEAYSAALECLRTYFNGENFTGDAPAMPDRGDDEPPMAGGATSVPVKPSPSPVPVPR